MNVNESMKSEKKFLKKYEFENMDLRESIQDVE
eukprot:CAMPEP_0116921110 /NCGR_PEP_ID=MMETSP0467-20121206/21424_1 /TAXON_ID=283647 /ORGANISM="Mesodinium pulex, Strain SPMC105" /LENGTH=32 /DNA_ID= /DNA_START= /DNA_END= /DNA_ORIENTATION=